MFKKRIPDRWADYSKSGTIIEGTKIICFKVPLMHSQPHIKRWNVEDVLRELPPTLGAVIDLTNTDRYYNKQEFEIAGVKHIKIAMEGRIIPPKSQVDKFIETIETLLSKNIELIGVHCTHGLNRTGYMVCRYMRDKLQMPAKEAISKFETARGHTIERANYIADLLGKEKIPPPEFGNKNHLQRQGQSSHNQNYQTSNNGFISRPPNKNWRARQNNGNYEEPSRDSHDHGRDYKRPSGKSRRESEDYTFSHKYDY